MSVAVVVRSIDTGEVEHSVDVTGKAEGFVAKVESGMLHRVDLDRFTVGVEDDERPLKPRQALLEIGYLVQQANDHPDGAWRGRVEAGSIQAILARVKP